MPRMKYFSTAIVLSPGVWQQYIEFAPCNCLVDQTAQRLAALLSTVLTLIPTDSHCPIKLQLEHPHSSSTSFSAHSPLLQLTHVTPRSGPAFLLIRLAGEIAVDIAAL